MNPRALLARCAPHAASYERGTGAPEITPADIAYAAAQIRHPAGRALVLYLWADDADSWPAARRELMLEVSRLAASEGWRVKQPGTLSGLLTLAVHELGKPRHCPRCNGLGERAGKPCSRCDGDGTMPYTSRAQSFVSGLPRRTLRDWSARYDAICDLVRAIERCAINDMRRALT